MLDLTITTSPRTPSFPGSPPVQVIPWNSIAQDGYNLEMLFMSTHTGTHIDAPCHFAPGGITVDRIPLGRLAGRARLVHCTCGAGESITLNDLRAFERGHGQIRRDDNIFFHTGWSRLLHDARYFTHNPGLTEAAAAHLASRGINMAAIDSPSIDPGRSRGFCAHHILCGAGILLVENLANLHKIRGTTFHFVVMPLKLRGASGAPVRAVAYRPGM